MPQGPAVSGSLFVMVRQYQVLHFQAALSDDVIGLLQCSVAVPYLSFCPDDDARRVAMEACERLFGKSFSPCLVTVRYFF